jgi:predicted PurR-regulated permease PerM
MASSPEPALAEPHNLPPARTAPEEPPNMPPAAAAVPEPADSPLTIQTMRRLMRQQIYFAVLVGAVIWLLFSAGHVIPLFIFSFLLAYVLGPVVGVFTRGAKRRHGFSRTGAILTVYALLILILAGAGWFIAGQAAHEVRTLSANFPALRVELLKRVHQSERSWPFNGLPPATRISIDNTINNLDRVIGDAVRKLEPVVVQRVPGLLEILVIPILAYYLLKDGRRFINFPRGLLREDQRARYDRLIGEIDESLRGYLKGQITLSLVASVMVFVILTVFRVHYAYLVAIAAFFLEFIPVVGPLLWASIAVLLTYIQHPSSTIFVLILVVAAHQFDMHILAPKILGGHLRLHPAVVIVALVIGNAIFGLLGALLAAPTAALLTITLRYLVQEGALSSKAVLPEVAVSRYPVGGMLRTARTALSGRFTRDRVLAPQAQERDGAPEP